MKFRKECDFLSKVSRTRSPLVELTKMRSVWVLPPSHNVQEYFPGKSRVFGLRVEIVIQSGFLSILYSIGSKPLQIWDKKVRNGHIKRITDNDIQSLVLEIEGTNVSTTYICAPADPKKTLGIKLPFLVMIIKNLKKYFTFEVQVCSQS